MSVPKNRCKGCRKEILWAVDTVNQVGLCFSCRQRKEGKSRQKFWSL